jgi:hypothetical protein
LTVLCGGWIRFSYASVLFPVAQTLLNGTIQVKIRVSGDKLDTQENHPLDPMLTRPGSEVNPEENPPSGASENFHKV